MAHAAQQELQGALLVGLGVGRRKLGAGANIEIGIERLPHLGRSRKSLRRIVRAGAQDNVAESVVDAG